MIISSPRNPHFVALRKLDQRRQRQLQGRFVAEGLQLLHMALAAGWQAQEVFYCPGSFTGPTAPDLLQRFSNNNARLYEVSEPLLRTLSGRDAPQGLVVTFALPQTTLADIRLPAQPLVLVLDRPRDPGNLGTLLRTADAVGACAALILPPCVDPLDPKALRASMGSYFNLPVVQVESTRLLLAWLQQQGLPLYGADTRGQRWTEQDWTGGLALTLGNEAQGLDEALAGQCERLVSLPLYGRAESLNVAVAGGVLMYAWRAVNPCANS